ncbi:MAG TPA: hypothetical protein VK608_05480 [Edaphobacter sp.]|nr:hypothetical protein [Edaphobacter sp.]
MSIPPPYPVAHLTSYSVKHDASFFGCQLGVLWVAAGSCAVDTTRDGEYATWL